MNRLMSDDDVLTELSPLKVAEVPLMAVDTPLAVRAGRSRRARRAVARTSAAILAVAAVGLGVPYVAQHGFDPIRPAAPDNVIQAPRALGDGPVVELAPGVLAANLPTARTLDDGTEVLDVGITTLNFSLVPGTTWSELPTVLVPVTDDVLAEHNEFNLGPDFDAGVTQRNLVEDELGPFAHWSIPWSSQESATLVEDFPEWLVNGQQGASYNGADTHVHAGKVPPWIPDPRVVIFSARGFFTADGSVTHAFELPTFSSGGPVDRLLYFVKIGPEQEFVVRATEADVPIDATLYFGSDGQVAVAGECTGTLERCGEYLGPELADVLETYRAP